MILCPTGYGAKGFTSTKELMLRLYGSPPCDKNVEDKAK